MTTDEQAIGTLLEARAQAIRSKDASAVLAHCAPDFVRYDLAPPLARGGAWQIVHEHISTPFYMDGSLKAAVDLTP
jgi:ketosteroid isomerase-like protein